MAEKLIKKHEYNILIIIFLFLISTIICVTTKKKSSKKEKIQKCYENNKEKINIMKKNTAQKEEYGKESLRKV